MDRPSDYDYDLPEELIAQHPLPERDAARLMVVHRSSQRISHHRVRELPELLAAHDCLVLNDTKVVPARLVGYRTATGGKWEGLFLASTDSGAWRIIGQTRGRIEAGETVTLLSPQHADGDELRLRLIERDGDGRWIAQPEMPGDALSLLARFGTVPLPPYIQREQTNKSDWHRYQTTFARRPGAVAAPTAGLHFTPALLDRCRGAGLETAWVTLHVGLGTFRPIQTTDLSEHRMHSEWCELPQSTVETIQHTNSQGGRVVAVGTTTVRTLESVAQSGSLQAWQGETDLFIRPPFEFRAVDALLTNFHLPKSTLLVLVSTFAGRDLTLAAYREAIEQRYRFFSYGDAMLIL